MINVAHIFLALFVFATGCGPSAYARHATALDVTGIALDGTATAIEEGCAARARALTDAETEGPLGQRLREHCTAAVAAYDLAQTAWTEWLNALSLAIAGDTSGLRAKLLVAALAAIRAYGAIAAALADVGVPVPPLPDAATAVTGGGGS